MIQKSNKPTIRIVLTPVQQAQSQHATSEGAQRLKLEALEARVAPIIKFCH
jgi:hypothetical protein